MNLSRCRANHSSSSMTFKNFLRPPSSPPFGSGNGKTVRTQSCLRPCYEDVVGAWRYSSTHSQPRHQVDVSGQIYALAALTPGNNLVSISYECCCVHSLCGQTVLEKKKKIFARFEPPTVQFIVSCYAHYIISAPRLWRSEKKFLCFFIPSLFIFKMPHGFELTM